MSKLLHLFFAGCLATLSAMTSAAETRTFKGALDSVVCVELRELNKHRFEQFQGLAEARDDNLVVLHYNARLTKLMGIKEIEPPDQGALERLGGNSAFDQVPTRPISPLTAAKGRMLSPLAASTED